MPNGIAKLPVPERPPTLKRVPLLRFRLWVESGLFMMSVVLSRAFELLTFNEIPGEIVVGPV